LQAGYAEEGDLTAIPKMGETDDAMEYDTELIFRHLCVAMPAFLAPLYPYVIDRCFYLDSPDNARKNGMAVKATNETKVVEKYCFVYSCPRE
jgi:DNA ligase 4